MLRALTQRVSLVLGIAFAATGCLSASAEPTASSEARLSEISYDSVVHLEGEALKQGLATLVRSTHRPLGYNRARDELFGNREFFRPDGKLECQYTGRVVTPTGSTSVSGFNTEHSWPQSMGASREPAKSDLNHLFPVDSRANSTRGNFPFGSLTCLHSAQPTMSQVPTDPEPAPVPAPSATDGGASEPAPEGTPSPETPEGTPSPETPEAQGTEANLPQCTQDVGGGSALGKDFSGRTAFEVRPEKRGDTARALFYFSVRYALRLDAKQEETLRLWHQQDPVDEGELRRNDAVEHAQKNRNPFIDHPEFVAKISDF